MKKRIWALIMVMVLISSLVACGGKEKAASLSETYEKMADMTTGVSEVTFDLSYPGLKDVVGSDLFNTISLKMTAVSESVSPAKSSVEISYKYGTATDYAKLTDLVVDGEDIYINATALKAAITTIATDMGQSQAALLLAMFQTEEYVKINQKELQDYITGMGVTTEEVPATMDEQMITQVGLAVVKHVVTAFEEITKSVTPSVISADGSKVTVTLTKENVKAVVDAIAKADLAKYYDAAVTDLEAIKGAEEIVTQAKTNKDTYISEFKTALEEISKEEIPSDTDGKAVVSFDVSGKKGDRVAKNEVTFEFKSADQNVTATLKATTTEKIPSDKKVVVPDKSTSFTEVMNTIVQMMGVE